MSKTVQGRNGAHSKASKRRKEADTDYREELHYLKECYKKQTRRLCETLKEISQTVKEMF